MNLRNKKAKELINIALQYTNKPNLSKMLTTIGFNRINYLLRDNVDGSFTFEQQIEMIKVIKKLEGKDND